MRAHTATHLPTSASRLPFPRLLALPRHRGEPSPHGLAPSMVQFYALESAHSPRLGLAPLDWDAMPGMPDMISSPSKAEV